MSEVRVAYGNRENISQAIQNGIIPKGCIIITKEDATDSELLFHDSNGNLKMIEEKSKFGSLTEAQAWANKYPCAGHVFTVHNGDSWIPYVVQSDNSLTPINSVEISDIDSIKIIDGGNSFSSSAT